MKPKVSVIMPSYNVEKYIKRGVESVLNQTLKEVELVVVDDASTDSTPFILEKFAATDERIKFIKLEKNGGPGPARNVGIDVASGECIMFLDPDDFLELDACELAYNQLTKNGNDVVKFGLNWVNKSNVAFEVASFTPFEEVLHEPNIDLKKLGRNFIVSTLHVTLIYKKSLLDKFNIRYGSYRAHEDSIVYINALCNAKSISVLKKPLYNYYIRQNSITATVRTLNDLILNKENILENAKVSDIFFKKAVFFWVAKSLIYWFEKYENDNEKDCLKKDSSNFYKLKKCFKRIADKECLEWLKESSLGHFQKYNWICKESYTNYFRLIHGKKKKILGVF